MEKYISAMAEDIENMIAMKVATNHAEITYSEKAKAFDRFCAEHFPTDDVVTQAITMAWVNDAIENSSRAVAHSRVAFIRLVAEYQKAIGKKAFIPPEAMLSGQVLFLPYIFSDEELTSLFNTIDNYEKGNSFARLVYSTYFRLTYTCGLRPKEGRELMRSDVSMSSGEIRIINTKWHKSRTVVMSDDMKKLMSKYIIIRDSAFPESEYLFPARSGGPYTAKSMQSSFTKFYALSCPDIPKELLPAVRVYDLRHRFATAVLNNWLDNGVDIKSKIPYLQIYMGHKKMESTAYYIHLLPENLTKSAGIDWKSLNAIIPEVEPWEE